MHKAEWLRQDREGSIGDPDIDSLFIDAWEQRKTFDREKWAKSYTWKVAGIDVDPGDFLGQQRACSLATDWVKLPRKSGGPTALQKKVVEFLVSQGGRARSGCISTGCRLDYEDPTDGVSKMVRRINKTLSVGDRGFHLAEETDDFLIVLGPREPRKKRP